MQRAWRLRFCTQRRDRDWGKERDRETQRETEIGGEMGRETQRDGDRGQEGSPAHTLPQFQGWSVPWRGKGSRFRYISSFGD